MNYSIYGKHSQDIQRFEKEKRYNEDFLVPNPKHYDLIDENYVYVPKNIFFNMFSFLMRFIIFLFGPIATFILFRLKIYNKKNAKDVKGGAIIITNHCLFTDSPLISRQIFKWHKFYNTSAPTNNKKGIGGLVMKAGGNLPFGLALSNYKALNDSITYLLNKKCYINFHPEQSLWPKYRKPRPFKPGAFFYASSNKVPVIPVFLCFRDHKRNKPRVSAFVGTPIYPKENLSRKENEKMMLNAGQNQFIKMYNNFYNDNEGNYNFR